ncbi:hypothetical protein [Pantoea piersonii]|uniref:hypothetical protein n=1 Tax=Pantoea piersonii TaxID=2364647 RepID=UPI0028AAC8E8|nr:hypothetical protein [Pantoea piersonii]
MSKFNASPEVIQKVALWFANGERGISSKTIASIAVGAEAGDWDCPHDADDFSRCYKLLKRIPELRGVLPVVAEKCPQWKPLVAIWDELTHLYETDLDECHRKIMTVRDECRRAGGWVELIPGMWTRTAS